MFAGSSSRLQCPETPAVSLIADKEKYHNHKFWTALSQYFACESDLAVKIPDSLSWEEAGCIQPLAVAIQVHSLW